MKVRFLALDAFRGLCALCVVVFHMHLIGSIAEIDFFRGSAIFVELFFVLSGFVLAHGYGNSKDIKFKEFMKARFFRLYPLHFFMLIVFILLEFGKLIAYKIGGITFNNAPFTNSYSVTELVPNLLLIQAWTPLTDAHSFNAPAWSISIEMYIYALLFLSIALFKSYRVLSWAVTSIIAFSLIYLDSKILMGSVLSGLSCFFGGAFTYAIYGKISHLKPPYAIATCFEALILICVVMIVMSDIEYRSIIAPVIFFLTVMLFAFEAGAISKFLTVKPLQYLGRLSYSIYMTHAAVLYCLTSVAIIIQKNTSLDATLMIGETRYLNFGSSLINNLVLSFTLFGIVWISSLTYKYVEIHGQKLNRSATK